jgi:5-methylcytosine-specific restriction protein A
VASTGGGGSAASRGYGHHWRERVRKPFLRERPLCVLCGELANVPDHHPETRRSLVARGVKDPDAFHRLRALCDPCHSRFGAKDD